jgi:predicted CXXCH cytochrome family protein
MEVLLRELREGPDGIPEYHDTEIAADELTIGSSADQNIQLLGRAVAGQQAVIRKSGSRLELFSRRGKVRLNLKMVFSAKLTIGDVIGIGGHQLKIVAPPAGFGVAIELRRNEAVAASEFEGAFRTDLLQTWLGKRKAAWLTVALLFSAGLLIPLIAVMMHRMDKPIPTLMPSDTLWTSGPLSPAHQQAIGDRCDSCHEKLFVRVQDSACKTCHETIHDHVTPQHLALTKLDATGRCATCHREHNQPATYLVNSGDGLCISCHADSEQKFGTLKVEPVRGFGSTKHPEYMAHLLKPQTTQAAGGLAFEWIEDVQSLAVAKEDSNLKFSHAQHMDPDRVLRTSDSKQLKCADCHRLQMDGEHFEPITMEERCASCHELTFDPGAPDRQLPHGKPREAIQMLQDYFTRKFSDPNAGRQTRERRRLPGHDEVEQTCTGAPFDCAMRSARTEIESQFSRRGCIGCHIVIDTHADALLDRFQVYPIRLANDYFPAGHFDHRSHQIQGKLTGDDACLSCHKAKDSKQSSDVMLPGMAKCEECHGDKPVAERIVVQCVSCHAYHPQPLAAVTMRPSE